MTNSTSAGEPLALSAIAEPRRTASDPFGVPNTNILKGEVATPTYYKFFNDFENRKFLYSKEGSAILISSDGNPIFLSAGSATFINPNEQWDILLGRGPHKWILSEWPVGHSAIPDSSLDSSVTFLVGNCSRVVRELTDRVSAVAEQISEWPNFTYAWFNMLIHEKHNSGNTYSLTPIFRDGADPISDLIESIKSAPQTQWNLTEAAKLAGYSPFHLSRVFRSIANMGFPEFVDRCRTEVAITKLLKGTDTMSVVSAQSGFGTPQAMRNAFREYTGFLPSEMRSNTAEID